MSIHKKLVGTHNDIQIVLKHEDIDKVYSVICKSIKEYRDKILFNIYLQKACGYLC